MAADRSLLRQQDRVLDLTMAQPGGDEVARRPADEILRLEREIADAERVIDPPVPPAQSAANTAVGVADELGRLLIAFGLVLAALIVLAVLLTPWIWIGVAAWVGLAAWTLAVPLRRRRRDAESGRRAIGR